MTEPEADTAAEGAASSEAPVVTVIVPAFNAEAHLRQSIEDLLAQSFSNIEVVIVDDGSTDGTAGLARELADLDDRVRAFTLPENRGVARAREFAVQQSRGDYLWFVDADDRRSPRAVELLLAAARATEADVVVCAAEFLRADGSSRPLPFPAVTEPTTGRLALRELLEGRLTGHLWNKLVRRRLATGIRYTPAKVHSDLAMVSQLLAAADRVAFIPDTLYSYLLREGSIIHSGSRRAESLVLVDDAVRGAVSGLDPRLLETPAYRYFRARFIVLSAFKDAVLGSYDAHTRRAMLAELRDRLGWTTILLIAARGDWRRLLLAVTAKVSARLHRAVLDLSSTRPASDWVPPSAEFSRPKHAPP